MRIRSTKPEFWRSERIASVEWDARLVLKGLESYVDDNGVGKDDLALIVADVFPRDLSRNPTGTLRRVSEAICALENAGLVWRYDDEGSSLLYIAFWESIQRIEKPSKGRFRRPDGTLDYRESIIRQPLPEPSRNTPGALRPGTGEQGNRGTGDKPPRASDDAQRGFDAWWDAYDKKVDRKRALAKYRIALRTTDPGTLLEAAVAYVERKRREGKHPEFTKDPATWLNGENWKDETTPNPEPAPTPLAAYDEQMPHGLSIDEARQWRRDNVPGYAAKMDTWQARAK